MSIYTDDIELHDPSGMRLHGRKQYRSVFQMLRFLRRTTMQVFITGAKRPCHGAKKETPVLDAPLSNEPPP